MISLKQGLSIKGVSPEILLGLILISSIFKQYNIELIITEITGGKHKEGSLHYKGQAVDIRSKHIATSYLKKVLLEECREKLKSQFDFILESENEENEHYHMEFDPK